MLNLIKKKKKRLLNKIPAERLTVVDVLNRQHQQREVSMLLIPHHFSLCTAYGIGLLLHIYVPLTHL